MRRPQFISILLLCTLASACCNAQQVKQYGLKVEKTYPHDRSSYTQGLFFQNGKLYETTGQYGSSTIREVNLQDGKALQKISLNQKYFGEGSCCVDGKMFVLTWLNKVAFVYDIETLKYEKTLSYRREGWGLTALPKDFKVPGKVNSGCGPAVMVASDGSSKLFFLDSSLRTVSSLPVTFQGRPLRLLNELEWIDGKIWANVYTTDMIVIINPSSGRVEGCIDCSGLLDERLRRNDTDVLNGIAIDGEGGIYLTGKNWPQMYKVRLIEK